MTSHPPRVLKLRLKDLLEREVDPRYYLSDSAVEKLLYTHTHRISGEISNTIRSSGHGSTDRHAWDSVRVDDKIGDRKEHGDCEHPYGKGLQGLRQSADECCDGIYIGQSESFHRGPLKGLSRTLKAEKNDAGVVIHGDQL